MIPKIKPILAILFLLALTATAKADEAKPLTWTVGPEASYITYKESEMKDTGVMYGVFGSGTYRGNLTEALDKGMLKAEAHLNAGQVNYDGELNDGTPYKIKNIDDFMGELRVLGGYDFAFMKNSTLTPYVGLGYRYLRDDSSKDPAGYLRESNYLYSPIGVETRTPFGQGWSLGFTAEYDLFWFGQQKSYLSDVASSLSDVTNDQKEGYGIRGSVKLTKATEKVDFFIEPFVRYWNIADSEESAVSYAGDIIGTAVEPENTSTEFGLRVGAEF